MAKRPDYFRNKKDSRNLQEKVTGKKSQSVPPFLRMKKAAIEFAKLLNPNAQTTPNVPDFLKDPAVHTLATAAAVDVMNSSGIVLPTGVSISPTVVAGMTGTQKQLTATVAPTNANDKTILWASSNTAIATVTQTGLVSFVAIGTVNITATTVNGKSATVVAQSLWDGKPTSRIMTELGHSFIANGQQGSTSDGYRSYGPVTGAADDSGQVVRRIGFNGAFGNGGDSSAQIDVRADAAIAAAPGGTVYVYNGTNDEDGSSPLTVDQTLTYMKSWKAKAYANKTNIVFHTIAPRGNDTIPASRLTTEQIARMKERNSRMLAELPATGCFVVDTNSTLLKPGTDFDILEKYSPVDAKHPSNTWVQEVSGPADAVVLKQIYANMASDKPTATSSKSINTNVEIAGASTTASATLPTGYTKVTSSTGVTGTTLTYQEVTTSTGRWCQVVVGGTTATANAAIDILRQISLQSGLVTGKTYEGVIEYEYDANASNILAVQLGLQAYGSSTALNWDNNRYSTQVMSKLARKGWMRTPPFTSVDGLTDFRFRLSAYMGTEGVPAATLRFRLMELREVV